MLKFLQFCKNRNVLVPVRCFVKNSEPVFQAESNTPQNKKDDVLKLKRFVKHERFREKKSLKPDFVLNLFSGEFDKNFLVYPEVLENEELDLLLKHSNEIEKSLINSIKTEEGITDKVLESLQEVEVFGLSIPQKYGGLGYNETETKFITECLGINAKIGRLIANNESSGINIISKFGNEEQKLKYLPKLASGESLATFAYLENTPLVDITSISTFSVEDTIRNCYFINGSKKWVQNAHISDIFFILAKASLEKEESFSVKYNVFVADKKTPGITIHNIDNDHAKEFNLYDMDLKNIFLPNESLIEADGYTILKEVMTSNHLNCAVLCLSLLKKMSYQAIQMNGNKKREHVLDNSNIGFLSTYIYVLETVIYLITGRSDIYDKPDLFLESCIAKILATDMLHLAIQKYLQIVGKDSFKESDILKEALGVLEHYMILDENNENLKKIIGGEGLKKTSTLKYSDLIKIRDRVNYPIDTLKWFFVNEKKIKKILKHELKMELHGFLQTEADILETCLAKIKIVTMEHIVRFGKTAMYDDYHLSIFSEAVVYIYALAACLARSSAAYCNDIDSSLCQLRMTKIFTTFVNQKVDYILDQVLSKSDSPDLFKRIGEEAFRVKEYPAEHPLTLTV